MSSARMDQYQEWQAWLARWNFGELPIQVRLLFVRDEAHPHLQVTMQVIDVDPNSDNADELIDLTFTTNRIRPESRDRFLRDFIVQSMTHEIDEQITRDGVRLFNPHATRQEEHDEAEIQERYAG